MKIKLIDESDLFKPETPPVDDPPQADHPAKKGDPKPEPVKRRNNLGVVVIGVIVLVIIVAVVLYIYGKKAKTE